jgi:hypothetical protein
LHIVLHNVIKCEKNLTYANSAEKNMTEIKRWSASNKVTVKNGKFKKILTLQITTKKFIICDSEISLCSFTSFSFFVAN